MKKITELLKIKPLDPRLLIPEFDSRMATISQNLYCASWYDGIEATIFRYLLDPAALKEMFDNWTLPSDCDKEEVLYLIEELKILWELTGYWYNGEIILSSEDWKSVYNKEALLSGWIIVI